jgi:hypothetical protein
MGGIRAGERRLEEGRESDGSLSSFAGTNRSRSRDSESLGGLEMSESKEVAEEQV